MVRRFALIVFLSLTTASFSTLQAQVLSSKDLDTARVFTSLAKALENPAIVLRLDLSKQKLGLFPEEVFQLINLQELRLDKCRLSELPNRFQELPNLQRMQCRHNELDTIPPSILSLKNLKMLDLSDNFIEIIPDEIDRLTQLETLALWDNPITYYPETLTEMQQLKVLDLLNNAMSRDTQQRLKTGLPKCKIVMSPPCACMDGEQ
jgi:Leucine-rich repeat (LRR) protein